MMLNIYMILLLWKRALMIFSFFKIFIFGDVVGGGEWKFMMGS